MKPDSEPRGPTRVQSLPTWRIGLLHGRAHHLLSTRLASEGLTGRQYRLLAASVEAGPASQADLGRRASLDRSDVVAAVDTLVGRRLLLRSPDPMDRRRNVVTTTPDGVVMLERLDSIVADVQDELLAPLSERDRHELDRLLDVLLTDD